MARRTKTTKASETPEVPETAPVPGSPQAAEAAPVPEAAREPGESSKPVSVQSAPEPVRHLQPTVKDELDDPFGMVGFLP